MKITEAQVRSYYERVLGDRIKSRRGDEAQALCLWHDDRAASLSINMKSGLWHCHAGCSGGDVFSFERKRSDCTFPAAKKAVLGESEPKIKVTYDYRDENRTLLYQVLRLDPKDFSQRRPDGNGGWVKNLKGTRRVPYRLPEVIAADTVFLPEGERDCDRLASLGLTASTNSGGGGTWRDELSQHFAGKRIIILPDNDSLGQKHAHNVAHSLHSVAASVRIVELSGVPEKGDISNWLDAGHTKEELLAIAKNTPLYDPEKVSATYRDVVVAETKIRFRTAAEIARRTPQDINWIALPWVARGSITEVGGKIKAAGKTTWVTHLTRAVLDGAEFMGQPTTKTSVVYLTEQPPASFRVALERADLLDREDFAALLWHESIGIPWAEVVSEAVKECQRRGASLMVVDTIGQFANLKGDSENDAAGALGIMKPLQEAASSGLGIIVIRHERKSGGEVGDAGRGSTAFGGAVDVVLSLRRREGGARQSLRVIHSLSRFTETPNELVIELTDQGYVALGETYIVQAKEAEEPIMAVMPTLEADAITLEDLIEASEVKRGTAQKALKNLLTEERLAETGEGKKGSPYQYWKPEKVSATTTSLGGRNKMRRKRPQRANPCRKSPSSHFPKAKKQGPTASGRIFDQASD